MQVCWGWQAIEFRASFSLMSGYWGAMTWLPTYLAVERELPSSSVAYFVTILNIGMFVGYNGFGFLADHIGHRRTIIITLLGVAAVMPIYAITSNHNALLWLGPLFGLFTAFFGLFGSYLSELFPTRVRSTGAGWGIAAMSPFLLAGISGAIGFSGGLIVCACFFALAAGVALVLPKTGAHADQNDLLHRPPPLSPAPSVRESNAGIPRKLSLR